MTGPVLVIELAEAPSDATLLRLRDVLKEASSSFGELRRGEYDLSVRPERLGIPDDADAQGTENSRHRPVRVSVMGPGIGDGTVFAAEHAYDSDEPDPEPLIGFTPTHAVDVIAFCGAPVDHVVTALLTAAVMDVTGGIANAELRADQAELVEGLPGLVATTTTPRPAAYGSAAFLRAWASRPGFRLLN
ncbi:DUF6368 family protein [Streptomyces boluensis]|uniref:Uncharacterized protein n=1 Tax=Streptomyces boluensis TaxID=1775135 RepID=A0A964URM4_9ACTN|nr:DUF6368 family protein [Streptomyces boluensis]NBE50475.1 hypothetical protein [Streptomyces boluensis]